MQLDKKVIGHEFKAFTTTVEAGKVRLFCKAIGEEDPIYSRRGRRQESRLPRRCRCRRRSCRPSPTTIRARAASCACSTSISA